MEKVESQMCKKLKVSVKRVVSVFHGNDHFAVMESNLDTNVITIYDGLNLGLNNWFHHITNVLKRTKLIGRNSLPTFHSNGKTELELVTEDEDSWIISKSIIVHQKDGYNCGPIACLVLGSIFEPEIVNISAISPHNYRSFVVTMFKEMVNQFNTELILPSDLHDTVSMTQQVNTEQVDFDGELMLNEMVARKLRHGNENRCARHAMERAVKETPMKSKKNARQKHAQFVRAQRQKDQSKYMKGRHMKSRQAATFGSIVTLKMDYRDVSNPHGIPAIVFALSTNELG